MKLQAIRPFAIAPLQQNKNENTTTPKHNIAFKAVDVGASPYSTGATWLMEKILKLRTIKASLEKIPELFLQKPVIQDLISQANYSTYPSPGEQKELENLIIKLTVFHKEKTIDEIGTYVRPLLETPESIEIKLSDVFSIQKEHKHSKDRGASEVIKFLWPNEKPVESKDLVH